MVSEQRDDRLSKEHKDEHLAANCEKTDIINPTRIGQNRLISVAFRDLAH